jgi:two-component system chemotaxis sensor kinase CheA
MDDILREFLTEANESLSQLDAELVKLEQNPNDQELLGNIFRLVHTIKGTCGFLGLPRLESVAHAGENVLGKVRDRDLEVTPEAVTVILECLDRIRLILESLEATEEEPKGDDSEVIDRLNVLAESGQSSDGGSAKEAEEDASPEELEAAFQSARGPEEFAAERTAATDFGGTRTPDGTQGASGALDLRKESVASQSIRVSVDVLEDLMTMVSELVLTRNQLLQILRTQSESEFTAPLQRLNHVVSELQEGVMATRMQPIGNAWAKLPRMIRDLAKVLGKKVDLVVKGAETELDRQVLELIKDPLTHMVRNSVDHGLEMPDMRSRAGKPETGRITLNAYHEGGHIIIEIADDGIGLSTQAIRQKCVAKGLATEEELEAMSEQQLQQFIFKAGFSTASEVTSVSGRGVGMDVVRTNIEKIGGTIELTSVEGRGTKFVIKIPLTLAIVSALIVESGGERFAIPQLSVVELVRASAHTEHTIERINGTPVLRLRNRLLPLVHLRELLGLSPAEEADEEPASADGHGSVAERSAEGPETLLGKRHGKKTALEEEELFIVVTQIGIYSTGIIVDRVFDTEEIVVKPVAPILRHLQLFSGNTILGDGSVVMTEDTMSAEEEQRAVRADDEVTMLVFKAVDSTPKAVPLALVARLEDIDLAEVEFSNGQHVVQYRGQLMPLISMDQKRKIEGTGRQPVLVFADRERTMGLVVDEIVDIVEDSMSVELSSDRQGYIGTAVIDGKATDVIDVSHYLTVAYQDWFAADQGFTGDGESNRLLLVDDSPFYRNLLQPLLLVAGYEVICVESADEALQLCAEGEEFDLIISDIQMPGMNGFEFAEKVRSETRWSDLPLVALSAYSTPRDVARGRSAGFTDYVAKTDRDALLKTLHDVLSDTEGTAA